MKLINSTNSLNSTKKDLYIFDFDGVLVDSVDVKTKAFIEIYKSFGSKVLDRVVDHHTQNGGMSRFDKFNLYHKEFLNLPIELDTIKKLSNRFSNLVVEKILKCKEIDGALDCLNYCKKKEIICAINSATPEEELNYIILKKGWKKYFKYIYGSPNTKSDNMKRIMSNANTDNSKTLFFGDSISDYQASNHTSVDFVGINFYSKKNQKFPCFNNFIDFLN